jgi:TonB-linked SusC/RagA family outer membrane protein
MKKIYGRLMLIALILIMLFFYMLTIEVRAANPSYSDIKMLPQQELKGVVSDQSGMPLPGVTVIVKGKNRGTTTDIDGKYSIAIEPEDVLIFSFIGFKSLEVLVNGRREILVAMEEDISSLGEVQINAGYYSTTKRESTGNISRVTAKEIELQPVTSPLQALQGRMAGVEIVQPSGVPGTAPIIRIRGQNSLRNGSDDNGNLPLYIIDGVPVISSAITGINSLNSLGIDPLNTLNLSNIESIEVLKDADATAIYGSRGANGVILITTKKGKGFDQETTVEVSLYSGIGEVSNKMKLLNTEQYLNIRKAAFENDGLEPTVDNAEDLVLWDQNRYTDWQEELFGGTSKITNMNLAVSGGNATTSFRLGGSYHKEGTVFPGDFSYNKVTAGIHLNHTSENKKLGVNLSVNYGVDNNDLFNGDSFVSDALYLSPNAPAIYNEDGSLNWENNTWDNPFALMYNTTTAQVNNIVANLGLSYQLTKGLSLKTTAGYTNLNSEQSTITLKKTYRPDFRDNLSPSSRHSYTKRRSWIIEPQLVYNNNFGDGNLDALVGVTFQQSENNRLFLMGTGYAAESLIGNLDAADEVTILDNTTTDYKYNAIFGRIGYNWQKKYFINFTGRRDGSSRFGPDKRFANFGAIGMAWIFSEESFINDNISFLSFGKLRGSYGTTGSDQIPDYGYLDAYGPTPGPGGLFPTQLTNPDYSWEENKKLEAAIDLGFIRDRINIGVSWYRNRSSNQLVGYPLPSTTGFATIQANLPATVQNTGWEFELSTANIQSKNFRWQTFINITIPENKLIDFPNIEQTSYANIYRVGHPLNIGLLYQFDGIDPETGFYRIADINEDGRFDYEDRIVIRDNGRKFYGGLNNNIQYKNFAIQFLWEFVKQDAGKPYFPNPGSMVNQPLEVFNAIQNNGDNNQIQEVSQSLAASRAYSYARTTDHFSSDASFLRLKTLSISYNLPAILSQKLGITMGNVFLNAHNLATITNYIGLDPQNTAGTVIPVLQTITCGLQINL